MSPNTSLRSKIAFEDITIAPSRVDLDVTFNDGEVLQEHHLWFDFSEPVNPTNDSVALALSTLCGKAFSNVSIDLEASPDVVAAVRGFTGAELQISENPTPAYPKKRSGHVLNFSGGFDSLAALSLMPRETQLVSLDFGGRFSREREFFETFDTVIVSTNLLDTKLQRNSWSFMGLGSLLSTGVIPAEYQSFGSILEAGSDNMRRNPRAAYVGTFPPFHAARFTNAPYVIGLTEIGTLIVLSHYRPARIAASLTSLASPGEEKLHRKQVLAQIVSERFGLHIALPEVLKPSLPHFKYGEVFALDFLALYAAKYAKESVVRELLSDIPDEVFRIAKELDLTFYERANTTLYHSFPEPLRAALYSRLSDAKVIPYTEKDWEEFKSVRAFLSRYHPSLAS
ncbi:hypothetical protein GCM10027403_03210 [Arthrobacter tecti]